MQDHKENNFYEVLCRTYGKPPSDSKLKIILFCELLSCFLHKIHFSQITVNWENEAPTERRTSEKISPNGVTDEKKQTGAKKVSPISGESSHTF